MAASKENTHCCSSSSALSVHRHHSSSTLRSPLSPIHHNSSCSRPPEHPTLAPRRAAAKPSRAVPLPPSCVKSPHQPARNPTLPRSPKPSNLNPRRLLRDVAPTIDLVPRFKTLREKDLTPAASTPRRNSSLHFYKPPQGKRQTELFVQQKAPFEPPFPVKAGPCNQTWMEHAENEKIEKPCRKKWRRYPRESVLRSLRGDDVQESSFDLAATGADTLSKNTNPCHDVKINPSKTEEHVQNSSLGVKGQLLSNVYGDSKLTTGNQASEFIPATKEEKNQECAVSFTCETEGFRGSTELPSGEKTLFKDMSLNVYSDGRFSIGRQASECPYTKIQEEKCESVAPFTSETDTLHGSLRLEIGMPAPGSPSVTHDETSSSTLTPPPASKSLSLTLQPERSLTPPMQSTQSPDFIKREGVRTLLPIDGTCYAVPCPLVKDRRKCKPRGVLTVDSGQEILSSAESELGYVLQQSTQQMPTPAVASVEWMVDEKKDLGDAASPEMVSVSMDLCRMSLPKLSPGPNGLSSEHVTSEDLQAGCILNQRSLQQASFSISGYDWTVSSSQDVMRSTHRREVIPNPRRSIIFGKGTEVDQSQSDSAEFKSTIMHNILFEDVPDVCSPSSDIYDEEVSDCLHVKEASPLEGSPPFEYSLLGSFKSTECAKMKQRSWSCGSPEEMILSRSGPTVSPLSSQEHGIDEKYAVNTAFSALCQNVGPLVINGGGQKLKGNSIPFDTRPQAGNDISSRLAMAKFLCNITATYLDDFASCLGKTKTDAEFEACPSKVTIDNAEDMSLEHSSLLAGRKKMVECCSLLRGLTLETSQSRETSSRTSECSVNQPSPSTNGDTADSLQAQVCSRRRSCRFQGRISSLPADMKEYNMESPQKCRLPENSQRSDKVPLCATKAEGEGLLPSKGFFAGSYLLAGLLAISHTYNKHAKRAELRPFEVLN